MRARVFLCALLALCAALVAQGCRRRGVVLDTSHSIPFIMADNLMGTVLKSSDPSDIGRKITLVGLQSATPKVVVENGTFPLTKMADSEDTMVLMLVTPGGSVDGFVVDKKGGKFARVEAGNYFLLDGSIAASASVGVFKLER